MHTHAKRGTPVLCILRDGSQVRGKFIERRRAAIEISGGRLIKTSKLRAMTIERGRK